MCYSMDKLVMDTAVENVKNIYSYELMSSEYQYIFNNIHFSTIATSVLFHCVPIFTSALVCYSGDITMK